MIDPASNPRTVFARPAPIQPAFTYERGIVIALISVAILMGYYIGQELCLDSKCRARCFEAGYQDGESVAGGLCECITRGPPTLGIE